MINIAQAKPDDAESIATVQHDTWIATYPDENLGITLSYIEERVSNYQSPERLSVWRSIIANTEEYVTVAKDGQKIIGFSAAKKDSEANQIMGIYVLPEYHGSGVAQKSMDAAMKWLGADQNIMVEVASYNQRAINFYRNYGFAPSGETGKSGEIPTLFMRRSSQR
jgi:ribosomal protein S18 acetylase RimI-like enzyme